MSTEPKYIAVEGRVPSIIKRCDDRSCDKYHTWIDLDSSDSFYDAAQIAKAMNLMDAPRPPLTIRDNPAMPDDETLERLFSLAVRDSPSTVVGLRAVWRHGCDAGMVAPESQGSST